MDQHRPEAADTQAKWLYLLIGLAAMVNLTGLFTPIMAPDGALYAMIAKTMVLHHNYADLIVGGKDWLDKPHFPFWIAAICYNCFGFTTFAYKFPAVLFLFMGAGYTYAFAKQLYNKHIALWSELILLTAQHIMLSNNDVRAEAYLTGLIIAAVYHFYRANKTNSYWQILAGCIFTACAIMTKGMFALVPIGGAIAGQLVINRQWQALFNRRWLAAIVLVFILIIPELWCLYQQFDLHPEKVVFGHTKVSGIRFFFWDSQFGRFLNTGPIKGHGDPSFFVHTTLWAFLPWSLLLFAAIFQFIKRGHKSVQASEWYCISGALLTFLLFSASKFQLPHYLNIVFPFFAIITAQYLFYIRSAKTINAVVITQWCVILIMLLAISVLSYFFKEETSSLYQIIPRAIIFIFIILIPGKKDELVIHRLLYKTILVSFYVNLYLNLSFYPALLHYQAASEAGMWVSDNNPGNLPVAEQENDLSPAFEFYSKNPVLILTIKQMPHKPFLLYASSDEINALVAKGMQVKTLHQFKQYRITRLKPKFLNAATRDQELTTMTVAEVF